MTTQVILHHYASSPFSEKVRLALGIKGLAWGSVEIAPLPPRPSLEPLTGGYRRAPVMQIGADIYCDTNIILPALERLYPAPALYPAGIGALSQALSFNWERAIWIPAIGVGSQFRGEMPEAFVRDRKDGYLYIDISKQAMAPDFALNTQRVLAQLAWLKQTLADGRAFVFGDAPSALDLAYFHPLLLIRKAAPAEIDALLDLPAILPWYERVRGLGHGTPFALDAEAALRIATEATPVPVTHVAADGRRGSMVTVTPDDNAKVPVSGTLVAADDREIVIRRDDPRAGSLHLHFPAAGFEMRADPVG